MKQEMKPEVMDLPAGTKVKVTEVKRDSAGNVMSRGMSFMTEVGSQAGRRVLEVLPHRSSYLPMRKLACYQYDIIDQDTEGGEG